MLESQILSKNSFVKWACALMVHSQLGADHCVAMQRDRPPEFFESRGGGSWQPIVG